MDPSDRPVRAVLACATVASFTLVSAPLIAQDQAPQPTDESWRHAARFDEIDEISTAEIHAHTTDPKYLTPLVSYVPEHDTVPSPRDVLGYIAGTAGRLTHPDDEMAYFDALAAASPRVSLEEMGQSEEGRRMTIVIVTAEENHARLGENRALMDELADPRDTSFERAQEIAQLAKPVMHITAGLHSPETGPPEMVMELAYRLAVSEHPDIRNIRDNVILLITPITEVDGRARIVEWYDRYLADYDNRDYMPPRSPPYWGAHAYHDNNRDGLQLTLRLTQEYVEAFHRWHPVYSLDLHESVPLLYVSTGTGPYNRSVDPITVTEWQWAANWELTELNRQGLEGVWTWAFYTGWNPGYLLWVTNNHNSMGRFYETFGNSSARTFERDLENARDTAGNKITEQQWYRANPPEEKFLWSLRNNTNYMQSGVLASLQLTAQNGPRLLESFWQKGRNSIDRGRASAPYGWHIPRSQASRDRLHHLLSQLRKHRIELLRATSDVELEGTTIATGDYVVRLDQPYSDFARNLLEIGKFPKDAPYRPYDDVSWTLGKVYRVATHPITDVALFDTGELELLETTPPLEGAVSGSGPVYAIANTGQNALTSLRYALADFEVRATEEATDDLPAGSLLFPAQEGLGDRLAQASREHHLDVVSLAALPDIPTHQVDLPRLALYHTWTSTQPDGWVRYTLGQSGIDYEYINDDDVRAGDLRSRFDVILVAHQGGRTSLKSMVHGNDPRFGPLPYTSTEQAPSHGIIDATDDLTGGFGFQGLAEIERFLDGGGTLLLLGSSGQLATESGLLRNVGTARASVSTPGSTLTIRARRAQHPILYGYDEIDHVFRTNAPLYDVAERFEHWIVAHYGSKAHEVDDEAPDDGVEDAPDRAPEEGKGDKPAPPPPLLQTGFVSGQSQLEEKAVVLDVPRSRGGRVVLYSFNPLHRHLNLADHNFVYNALLHWNDFPEPTPTSHPGLARD